MKQFLSLIILVSIFLTTSSAYAGGPADNMQKYWIYRERVKNFMFEGNGNGSGLVLGDRDKSILGSGDEPWQLGYYIASLAMEWKLLHDHGFSTAQTEKDLYFAIPAGASLKRRKRA